MFLKIFFIKMSLDYNNKNTSHKNTHIKYPTMFVKIAVLNLVV